MTRRRLAMLMLVMLGAGGACTPDDELPATLITGPRVLAIKAEPAAVGPGETTTVTALIVGTGAETPSVAWLRCRRAPRPGDAVNPDCVDTAQADYLEPIGEGPTIATTMPADVAAAGLGQPDASGGVYLPLVARVTVGGQSLVATYRLRLATGADLNHNPDLTGVLVVAADGTVTALDEASPPAVRADESLTLQAAIAEGSVEIYAPPLGGVPVPEALQTSWFSTAGRFSRERTDDTEEPTTVLELRETLPAPGAVIDLYAVTRDGRGGVAYVHRTLAFGQ
jgi:hypothetical protein